MAAVPSLPPSQTCHNPQDVTKLLKLKLKNLCQQHLLMSHPPRTALRDWMLSQFITPDKRWSQGLLSTDLSTGDIIRKRIEYVLPCKIRPDLSYIKDSPCELLKFWHQFTKAAEELWIFCGGSVLDRFVVQARGPCPQGLHALKCLVESLRMQLVVQCNPHINQLIKEFLIYVDDLMKRPSSSSVAKPSTSSTRSIPNIIRRKLVRLYRRNPRNDLEACDRIVDETWRRFDALDIGNHALAVPKQVWQTLKREFNVVLEGFSNAVNCHEGQFCSPFPELEAPFGAVGNFFAQTFKEGGVVAANPPYVNEIMTAMAEHVITSLENAEKSGTPLAFFSCFPCWNDAPAFLRLKQSPFCLQISTMDRVPFESVMGYHIFVNTYCLWLANPIYVKNHPDGVQRFNIVIQAWYTEKTRRRQLDFNSKGHEKRRKQISGRSNKRRRVKCHALRD